MSEKYLESHFLTIYNLSIEGFKTKTSHLVQQFLGGAQGVPTFFLGLE
jgi:hypothetical protein